MSEISSWFIPRVIPHGDAPADIKVQWKDVPLPVRYSRSEESLDMRFGYSVGDLQSVTFHFDSVSVRGLDAVKSLRIFERHGAADWWEEQLRAYPNDSHLIFDSSDGHFCSQDYMALLLPGIETFDETETD